MEKKLNIILSINFVDTFTATDKRGAIYKSVQLFLYRESDMGKKLDVMKENWL